MKMYFTGFSDLCWDLKEIKSEMLYQGLKELEAWEAIPTRDNDYFYCKEFMEVGEKGDCGKSCCKYAPKNGKSGCCKHVGKLYEHGNKLTIKL